MTAHEVVSRLLAKGCVFVSQNGSHRKYRSPCGKCTTVVAMHSGDIPKGTLGGIKRDMNACLGRGWLD